MKYLKFLSVTLAAGALFLSCAKENPAGQQNDPAETVIPGTYYGFAEVSVPAGTRSLFVEYMGKGGKLVTTVPVEPVVAKPEGGKDVEPFGTVKLLFSASRLCRVERVYYEAGDATKTEQVDVVGGYVLESTEVPVVATKAIADDVTVVTLSEPASYITSDEDQTFYHSSGVVMVEDSWPSYERGKNAYDYDFDDVVVDYDFEAKVMPERILGARDEQVIAVLHLRVVGSNVPESVGVMMEGFDMSYVDRIEEFRTLDSWQNPHGELPTYIQNTLGNPENTRLYTDDPKNPVLEIGSLQSLNNKKAGQGADAEYTYTMDNGKEVFENHTVFNVCYKWSEPDKTQYDNELEAQLADGTIVIKNQNTNLTMAKIREKKYYNCIPGYVNVAGGLFTYTVIFHMKNRAEMSAEESAKAKQMMIDAVMNTTSQNFFCLATPKDRNDVKLKPVGLKGYAPVLIHSESVESYNNMLTEGAANILSNNPYAGTQGQVWAFKCPTRTKHVWNKMYFDMAYPNYDKWIKSEGTECADWYDNDIDGRFLTCWW